MNKYIIYTPQGYCENPNGNEICNCQVLGRESGETPEEAIKKLLASEFWILEDGYDPHEFITAQLHDSEWV